MMVLNRVVHDEMQGRAIASALIELQECRINESMNADLPFWLMPAHSYEARSNDRYPAANSD
jgi:hypothetical protein